MIPFATPMFYSSTGGGASTGDLSGVNSATLSVPQTGRLLIVRGAARSNLAAASSSGLQLRFNSDAASNYRSQRGTGTGVSVAASFVTATGSPLVFVPASTSPSGDVGVFEAIIPLHTGTDFNKIGISRCAARFTTATTGMNAEMQTFAWLNTAAITTVTAFEANSDTFASGSYFEIEVV